MNNKNEVLYENWVKDQTEDDNLFIFDMCGSIYSFVLAM